MCVVYNSIGCLTYIKSHLILNNVNDFRSINELVKFQKEYTFLRNQINTTNIHVIEQEKKNLGIEKSNFEQTISKAKFQIAQRLNLKNDPINNEIIKLKSCNLGFTKIIIFKIKSSYLKFKVFYNNIVFEPKAYFATNKSVKLLDKINERYSYILNNFDCAVNSKNKSDFDEIERKKYIIDEIDSFIYGAIGENKVDKLLRNLNDDCFLINDFNIKLSKTFFNKNTNQHIKSVQIDHLLITPAGVFVIETKNWSQKSITSGDFRSPVEQVKNASYVIFKIVEKQNLFSFKLNFHNWGIKNIPIKNIIVLINQKPIEQFQFVKILNLNELLNYIQYFKPIFTPRETESIANYLVTIDKKNIF